MHLLNILIYWLTKAIYKDVYPYRLLPRNKYTAKIDFDYANAHLPSLGLIRRSKLDENRSFDRKGLLRIGAIEVEDLPLLSMNISAYKNSEFDIKFSLDRNSKSGKTWLKEKIILITSCFNKYTVESPSCPIFITLNALHNIEYPYYAEIAKPIKEYIKNKQVQKEEIYSKYKFKCKTKIIHSPLNGNYWHAELEVIGVDGNPLKYSSNPGATVMKMLNFTFTHRMKSNTKKSDYLCSEISPYFYLK